MAIGTDLWGVTEKGFYRPTLEDIIAEKNKTAKEIFGEDFDTGELTPQGKFFRINAAAQSKLCEIAEKVYYSIFPSTATGISLDRVCEFANLTRESAGYAVHVLKVYGKSGYTIEAGTKFKNDAGTEFYSTQLAIINNPEEPSEVTSRVYAEVTVQCTESGVIGNVQNINATCEVDTNINVVEYSDTLAYGTEIETDKELYEKYSSAIQGTGTNTTNSIKANVLKVPGVNDVIIMNNTSDEDIVVTDDLTVDSHSYAVIVHSDDTTNEEDIAEALREKQPFGIKQCGTKSVTIKDDAGIDQVVKFSYVEKVNVNVNVTCSVDNTFVSNGVEMIENNITSYINNLGIGEEVVFSRLYDYIYNVTGVYKVTSIMLNGEVADVAVPKMNIAKVGTINVDVTEV